MSKIKEALSMKLDPIQTFVAGNLIKWAIQQPQVKADSMRDGVQDWVAKGQQLYPQFLEMSKEGKGFTLANADDIGSVHMILKWAADQPEVLKQSGPGALINLKNVADQILNPQPKNKIADEKPIQQPADEQPVPTATKPAEEAPPVPNEEGGAELGSGDKGERDYDPDRVVGESRIYEKEEAENILKDGYKAYVTTSMKDDKFNVAELKGFADWVAEQSAAAVGAKKDEPKEKKEKEEPKEKECVTTILPTESKRPIKESTVAEWESDISKISDEEKAQYVQALDTLEKWQLFKSEFDWTQIFALRALLQGQAKAPAVQPEQQPAPETKATMAPPSEGKVPDIGKDTEGDMVKKLMEKHGLLPAEEGTKTEEAMKDQIKEDSEVKVDFGDKEVSITSTDAGTNVNTELVPDGQPLPEPVVEVIPAEGAEHEGEETPEEEELEHEPVGDEPAGDELAITDGSDIALEGKVPNVGKDTEGELQKKLQEEVGDNLKKWLK